MTDIAFYHLLRSPLEAVLPKLLEKTREADKRAVVMAGSEARVEALNALLWAYDQDSWLPHGSAKDGNAEDQPIWLTEKDENPNAAQFLFLTDGVAAGDPSTYERCFDLFDGRDEEAVAAARERWRILKEAGHALTYWQQNEQGRWEEKAG
jgi:DNA polymerase-3 subunit chi